MPKITWDESGKRYYETGVDHGVLYLNDQDTYDKAVAWNGLTAVTESPGGAEATDLWADNIKYASIRSAETFGGTIEAYTYPDEFAECDGSKSTAAKGVTIGQQSRKSFGLSYRTKVMDDQGKEYYKIHLVYGCTASPSEKAYSTVNDSPEAITFSWEFETTPVNTTAGQPTAHVIIDTRTVDSSKLTEFETTLYGESAKLPLPDAVITALTADG